MTELRECPFCGGAKYVVQYRHGLQGHRWIECTDCDAQGPVVVGLDAATSAWNRRADDWQDIDTAPRDGTRVMLWCTEYRGDGSAGVVFSGQWEDDAWLVPQHDDKQGGWCDWLGWEPTHWRPLPKGPGR